MMYLGDFPDDATVRFKWNTNAIAGESITRATNGTISVYKDDGTTQTTTGVTDTEDFDSLTGVHHCSIATTDSFYSTGSEFQVVLSAATIDGKTINTTLAHFSIERAGGALALMKLVKAVTDQFRFTVANVVDSGVVVMGANTITSNALAAGAVTEIQTGLATSAALTTVEGKIDTIDDLLDTEVAAIKTVVDAIQEKTDNLPVDPADASVIAGRFDTLDTSVADLPTNAELATALDPLPTANENADALLVRADGIETGYTLRDVLRLIASVALGKVSGGGTGTEVFRSITDAKDRVTSSNDEDGNRSAVTLDAS